MRLIVKKGDQTISEFQFATGMIHIGRHADSQIFLPDRTVSRHHAVIYNTQDGKWIIEDLDSPNKTFLNGRPIHKTEVKTDDLVQIADFTIEINLEYNAKSGSPINMQDTLTKTAYKLEDTIATTARQQQVIIRRPNADNAPDIKMPARRTMDFVRATEAICRTNGLDEVLAALLKITAVQFSAFHIWCALRNQSEGPMICHGGKCRDGTSVDLSEIKFNDKITQAVEKSQFLLIPRIVPAIREQQKIQSAMIAPIVGQAGCFGVIYIDNDLAHEHYTLSDLDYLLLLAVHTSVIIENF